jgi:hypothetical protein
MVPREASIAVRRCNDGELASGRPWLFRGIRVRDGDVIDPRGLTQRLRRLTPNWNQRLNGEVLSTVTVLVPLQGSYRIACGNLWEMKCDGDWLNWKVQAELVQAITHRLESNFVLMPINFRYIVSQISPLNQRLIENIACNNSNLKL